MPKKKSPPENSIDRGKRDLRDFARYSNLGFKLIAVILAAFFLGWKLDHWLSIPFPVFTLVFSLGGLVGILYLVIKELS